MRDSLIDILASYSNIRILHFTFALLFLLSVFQQEARAQTDSLYLDLDEVTHVGRRNTSSIQEIDGVGLRVKLDQIQNLPKILGNTDPLSFVRMLPGVQTGSEYDSGGGGITPNVDHYAKLAGALACGGMGATGERILAADTVVA